MDGNSALDVVHECIRKAVQNKNTTVKEYQRFQSESIKECKSPILVTYIGWYYRMAEPARFSRINKTELVVCNGNNEIVMSGYSRNAPPERTHSYRAFLLARRDPTVEEKWRNDGGRRTVNGRNNRRSRQAASIMRQLTGMAQEGGGSQAERTTGRSAVRKYTVHVSAVVTNANRRWR